VQRRVRDLPRCIVVLAGLLTSAHAGCEQSLSGRVSGVDLSARDLRVRPGDDFFQFALGSWYVRARIPADQTEVGVDSEVSARVREQLRILIESSVQHADKSQQALIGGMFASFMDESRIEKLDAAPLRADLNRIAQAQSKGQFLTLMAASSGDFGASLFSLRIEPDAKSSLNVLTIGQAGLGLDDPNYYVADAFAAQRDAYRGYIAGTLRMVNYADPDASAAAILDLETEIAKVSWSQAQRRDLSAIYNPMTVAALQNLAPGFSWRNFLDLLGLHNPPEVVLREKSAVVAIARIYTHSSLPALKAWQAFHTIDNASRYLSRRFVDNRFAFHGTFLMGMGELPARWKRGVNLVDASLGQALGWLYTTANFSPEAKQRMEALIGELRLAMAKRIRSLDWMSEPTKREALAKLAAMRVFVGYPSKWRDYSGLAIDRGDLYGNLKRSMGFDWAIQCATLGKPLDKEAWGPFDFGITPQTVDAFNIASENLIIFPAAILQPPFFDPNADPAHNYGAIGAVIGHEITHAFDDQGRKIDAAGKLRDWWVPEDAQRFERRAAQLVGQYDDNTVLPGVHVNGRRTLGENIADLGGLLVALDAYHAVLGTARSPVVDGLTGDQRVFLGWAHRWRKKMRDDALRDQTAMDVHAPATVRTNAPLRNIDAWYAAFDIRASDRNYLPPARRVRIW
jgi:putative endopeptidase